MKNVIRAEAVTDKRLDFRYLPDFAAFLLEHKLEDVIREQLRISREINLPMLHEYGVGYSIRDVMKKRLVWAK